MDTQAATSFGACYGSYEVAPSMGRDVDEGDRARVVRSGGSWGPSPGGIRSAHRAYRWPDFIGLRVARTL